MQFNDYVSSNYFSHLDHHFYLFTFHLWQRFNIIIFLDVIMFDDIIIDDHEDLRSARKSVLMTHEPFLYNVLQT